MKKITLLAMLFSAVAFTSCSKDSAAADPNGTSSGNYFPMAVGNVWNMKGDTIASAPSTITGTDVFSGTTYYKISNSFVSAAGLGSLLGSDTPTYVVKKGATYFTKVGDVNTTESGVAIKVAGFEMPILRDDLAVAGTWTGTVAINVTLTILGIDEPMKESLAYTGTILEKNVAATVNGVSYPDVIKASLKELVTGPSLSTGQTQTTEIDQEVWYAKGVGPIKMVQTTEGKTTELDLVNCTLK